MNLSLLRRRSMSVIALTVWLSLPSTGATVELTTAVQRTLESSPQLQLYPYHIRALEGERLQAGLKPNPTLNVDLENAFGTGDSRFLSGSELTLSLSQMIELADKREKRVALVDQKSQALQQDYEVKRLDVIAAVLRDFYNTLRLQQLISWNKQRIEAEKAALKVITKRAKAGIVGQADVMRMQLHLSQSTAKQAQLDAEHAYSLKVLAAHWAATADFSVVEGSLKQLPTLPNESLLNESVNKTPSYLLAQSETRFNQAQLALEQAKSKANITVGAGIRRLEANDDNALVFSFSMPLQWHDTNQGNIQKAQAQYQETLANQHIVMDQLKLVLGQIRSAMQNNISQVEQLQTELLPVATALLSEVKRGYQLGQYSVLQWVDAQDELFNIERELIEAQHAVHLQFLELERLSGTSLINADDSQAAHKE